ncbi:MAG: hypothetical protein LUG12_01680 [Erysipelotrichaceae bacterium]|nr:hypothetical protein [Erysipelotrichaceae bacterium]
MSRWIKNDNKYYYVKYDDSEEMRIKYSSKVLRYNIIAFDFVQQPKKVFNTDVVVEEIMNQLSIDDEVRDIVKRDFKMIPIDHLQFLVDNDIRIVSASDETYYDGNNRIIGINSLKPKEGMVAHEMGHMFVDINNLYKNNELKMIMQEILDNSIGIIHNYVNNDLYIYIESKKFIREYQGRTYILEKDYYINHIQLVFSDLEEYVSVGFETFVINPKLLYTKDRELYDFIEKGGLTNESI